MEPIHSSWIKRDDGLRTRSVPLSHHRALSLSLYDARAARLSNEGKCAVPSHTISQDYTDERKVHIQRLRALGGGPPCFNWTSLRQSQHVLGEEEKDVPGDEMAVEAGKRTDSAVAGKKRKAERELDDEPMLKVAKPNGPVDVERQCGVILASGHPCARSLACKSHSMGAKRSVPGRSLPYDMLLAAYQRKNQVKQQQAAINANTPLEEEGDFSSSNMGRRLTGVDGLAGLPLALTLLLGRLRSKGRWGGLTQVSTDSA